MTTIAPCLWFDGQAEEAARFYVSVLPDSRIDAVVAAPIDTPGASVGRVLTVEFTLAGRRHLALNAGPAYPHSPAISLVASCPDQAEIDRVWDALLAGGGAPSRCGWLTDRFGVSWQVVPDAIGAMLASDPERSRRVLSAVIGMVKLDLAAIERAYRG